MNSEAKTLSAANQEDSIVNGWRSMQYGATLQILSAAAQCWWSGEALNNADATPAGALSFSAGEKYELRTSEELRVLRCVGAGATLKVMPHSSRQPDDG